MIIIYWWDAKLIMQNMMVLRIIKIDKMYEKREKEIGKNRIYS